MEQLKQNLEQQLREAYEAIGQSSEMLDALRRRRDVLVGALQALQAVPKNDTPPTDEE